MFYGKVTEIAFVEPLRIYYFLYIPHQIKLKNRLSVHFPLRLRILLTIQFLQLFSVVISHLLLCMKRILYSDTVYLHLCRQYARPAPDVHMRTHMELTLMYMQPFLNTETIVHLLAPISCSSMSFAWGNREREQGIPFLVGYLLSSRREPFVVNRQHSNCLHYLL